ncbi:hypothetical protein HPB52_005274 [Rhipicephalus sanguineus]|uniref:Uncharacterized protein n=1 Tax=Rhipicephalus sanguineus TaxID=34632 RepID=A0A9D4QGP3_RHISA|nr:hypothetical protein HPB52_005274 [Rhipicephalus sanguineus]
MRRSQATVQMALHARPRLIFATSYGSCTVKRSLRLSGRVVVPMATQANCVVCFVLSTVPKSRSPTFMQQGSSSRRDFTPAKAYYHVSEDNWGHKATGDCTGGDKDNGVFMSVETSISGHNTVKDCTLRKPSQRNS